MRLYKGWRESADVTQTAIAESTGIPRQYLNEMEKGKRPIGPDDEAVLANFYGVERGVIAGEVDLPEPQSAAMVQVAERLEAEAKRLRALATSNAEDADVAEQHRGRDLQEDEEEPTGDD